ncbi:tripartite tricarboxylate transporter TctB family protein [Devosia sp. BK]|uniref:tripartite tricarboxylate transporter TctB family protein n=1 Tax=Devosia sp. BK TaxID=2871706 RepID=UPI00293B406F|nr:tripartite tricarboxylate transporter TctB family protein [Devosia sp. BK]MDV3249867.1 tripartite tricarboxylate transporter TctB family protein [Devosia sp. BK]
MSTDERNTTGGSRAAASTTPKPYWIGLGLMVMGAVWLYNAFGLPQGARYAAVGPGLFVTVAGGALLLLGALLMVQIWRGETFEAQDVEDADGATKMDKRAFLTALVAVALPIVTMGPLGMPFTATLSFVLVANAFGSRRWYLDLVYGAILASGSWFLFHQLGLQLGRFFPPLGV